MGERGEVSRRMSEGEFAIQAFFGDGGRSTNCATSSSSKLVRVFTSRAHQYIPALFILTKIA